MGARACRFLREALALFDALASCIAAGHPALICARGGVSLAAAQGALALLCALAPATVFAAK
eukprot:6919127-Lingulodinium_polyedra.AAC.1